MTSHPNQKKAALLGATGLVGEALLRLLTEDPRYRKILVYQRSEQKLLEHEKIEWHIGDLVSGAVFGDQIPCDDLYCAIGTTQSKTPNKAEYKAIDVGIPLQAASKALSGGLKGMAVVSSMGADPASRARYPRVKGQLEQQLQKMAIPRLKIMRPSFIFGQRGEFRPLEKLAKGLVKLLAPVIPKAYQGVEAVDIAKAMIQVLNASHSRTIITSDEIKGLAKAYSEA